MNEDASELRLGDDFKEAEALSISEVALILKEKQEQQKDEQLNESFEKTLAYVERFGKIKNKESIKEIRNILAKRELHSFEVASLINLCPEKVDEAKTLLPSLRRIDDNEVQEILDDIENYKQFA